MALTTVAPAERAGAARRGAWPLGVDLVLALVFGAAHTVSFVHTEAWPLQLLGAGWLAWRASRHAPRAAGLLGLVYGSGWLAAGTWWTFVSLHTYGGLPAWLAVLAVALLCVSLSIYLGVAMAAFARWRTGRVAGDAVLFASVWLLAELARGVFFTGFPWVAGGYAHVDSPLAGLAPWVGVYGIGCVGAGFAAAIALTLAAPRRPGARLPAGGVAAALALLLLGLGVIAGRPIFSAPGGRLSVTLLQGNVPQNEKFAVRHVAGSMAWTSAQLQAATGDLVVAPETVIPLLPHQLAPSYWQPLLEHFQRSDRAAIVGLPLGERRSGYTNSAAGISAATTRLPNGFYRYDKHHLVPFGEFIPPGFRWFTDLMEIPLGDFARGPLAAPSFVFRGERIAPNICYEDLFGEELAARFTDPATAPTLFANLSNIAWFGRTIAIDQHLHISRMRSLEFERPMLRATNTGATAVIDHRGVVTAQLEPHTQGVLDAQVEGRTGVTPFARWAGSYGLWPAWMLGVAGVLLAGLRRARP